MQYIIIINFQLRSLIRTKNLFSKIYSHFFKKNFFLNKIPKIGDSVNIEEKDVECVVCSTEFEIRESAQKLECGVR
uniref:Uncharacterized protein n=1 Tax=Meloidogyne enterolobii TaxID=390850 RepID=A0A6V7YBA8_MELEN|nr:unnamed protein product [Meloidogyne enterolobii]